MNFIKGELGFALVAMVVYFPLLWWVEGAVVLTPLDDEASTNMNLVIVAVVVALVWIYVLQPKWFKSEE